MAKKREKKPDPRLQTKPGHYLRNAPWRPEFVEEPKAETFSKRDSVVLAFLVLMSVAVAAALWLSPPRMLTFKAQEAAISGQATLAGNRIPRPYNGLSYDPSRFEEVREDDPIVQDDLEDILLEEEADSASTPQTL